MELKRSEIRHINLAMEEIISDARQIATKLSYEKMGVSVLKPSDIRLLYHGLSALKKKLEENREAAEKHDFSKTYIQSLDEKIESISQILQKV